MRAIPVGIDGVSACCTHFARMNLWRTHETLLTTRRHLYQLLSNDLDRLASFPYRCRSHKIASTKSKPNLRVSSTPSRVRRNVVIQSSSLIRGADQSPQTNGTARFCHVCLSHLGYLISTPSMGLPGLLPGVPISGIRGRYHREPVRGGGPATGSPHKRLRRLRSRSTGPECWRGRSIYS